MVNQEQQREILAVGLLALALFVLLALLPVSLLGAKGVAWFPSGNVMGAVGREMGSFLIHALGMGAFVLPVFLALGGLRSGEWLAPGWTLRLAILGSGLLFFLPPSAQVLGAGPAWTGTLGSFLAGPLVGGLGGFGSLFLLATLTVLLLVGTLGWNPLRPVGRGMARGAGVLGLGAGKAGKGIGGWIQARAARREARRNDPVREMESPEDSASFSFVEGEAREERAQAPEQGVHAAAALGADPAPGPPHAAEQGEEDALLPDPHPPAHDHPHELPPLDHLDVPDLADRAGMERELDRLGEVLVEKLGTFNVECSIGGRTTGPVVTQFEVVPAPGVKVNRIANLDADLALAMKARSIRIVAPIPGKGAVGVEIPNPKAEMVLLREILEAPEFARSRAELPLALGRDLTGKPFVADLAKMPHALIAGATGSGKSVCLNAFITSLVYRHTPDTLRFLLIDPKMVELSAYVDLPHLRHPVVTDPREAAGVLKWAVYEMERRYELLHVNTVRSLAEFNKKVRQGVTLRRVYPKGPEGEVDRWIWTDGPLPYLVLVVDELADLMMTVQSEVEKPLTLLAL